jgi:hypothetical protein
MRLADFGVKKAFAEQKITFLNSCIQKYKVQYGYTQYIYDQGINHIPHITLQFIAPFSVCGLFIALLSSVRQESGNILEIDLNYLEGL